jgi:AAA domain
VTEPFALAFSRLSEQKLVEREKCLIYGGSGVGKTALLGTLGSRVLFIDTGQGLDTLRSPWFQRLHPGTDPIVVSIIEKLDARGNVTEADAYDLTCDAIDYAVAHAAADFDHVVVDDATALRAYAMTKSSEVALELGIVKQRFERPKSAKDKPEPLEKIITEVQEWMGEMNLVLKFLRGTMSVCYNAGKHLWIGAHEKFIYRLPRREDGKIIVGEQPEVIMTYPAFTGKQYPDQVQSIFDDVWHLEVEGGERKLRIKRSVTSKYGDVMAKTRHDGVFTGQKGESIEFIRNPNLTTMMNQLNTQHREISHAPV